MKRQEYLKERQKKEAEAAAEEFKANLELQKKRMKEKRAKNEREAERWNNFQIENRNYLVAKEKLVSMRREAEQEEPQVVQKPKITREAAQEEPRVVQRPRITREAAQEEPRVAQRPKITLEKPIYKARTIVTTWGRLPGNHYGLSQEEASFHGKPKNARIQSHQINLDKARIAEALRQQAQGASADQNVLDAWYNSDVRRMQREMEEPRHRLHEYTKKASWNLLEEGRCEPKPENEDMQVVHYLFSFLNWDGIRRRFLELIGKRTGGYLKKRP